MRKLLFMFALMFGLSFVSCKNSTSSKDSAVVDTEVVDTLDTVQIDTATVDTLNM